jgi:hypothetical protein
MIAGRIGPHGSVILTTVTVEAIIGRNPKIH